MPGSSRIFHTTPQDSHGQTSCLVFELFQVFHMVLLFKVIKCFAVTFASVACCTKKDFAICHCPASSECLHLGTSIPMIHSFCQKMLWNNCFVSLMFFACFSCTFRISSLDMCCTHIVCTSRRFALRPVKIARALEPSRPDLQFVRCTCESFQHVPRVCTFHTAFRDCLCFQLLLNSTTMELEIRFNVSGLIQSSVHLKLNTST